MDRRVFVLVGGGLVGDRAAQTLREEGFTGRVVLIGEEPELPYQRPPLSKEFLRGEVGPDALRLHRPDYYEAHRIEWIGATRAVGPRPPPLTRWPCPTEGSSPTTVC